MTDYRQYQTHRGYYEEPADDGTPEGKGCWGAAVRGFVTTFLVSLIVLLLAFAVFLVGYVYVALRLPAPEELSSRAAAFVSTKIYDRNGVLLYEMIDPNGGRRTLVPLADISPHLVQATIATEDPNFYEHPGVDPVGLIRAIVKNLQAGGEIQMGGSTIPQQLVKLLFLSPEQTYTRKIKEAILAAEVTRRYSKDQILEIYLNEIPYGNHAYGIEAAAETYFEKPASSLTLAEASLLAGIPQAPALYDPFTNPEGTLWRRAQVLRLMVKAGYIAQAEADMANLTPLPTSMKPFDIQAPHFVMYVRQQLETRYGPEVLYKAGLQVHTTLDYSLQEIAENTVRQQVLAMGDRNVTNGALVALRPATGEILAMVGSRGYFDPDIDGQVNVTIRPRQPGSAIKPVTYLAAFEKGWTPATLLWDVETEFPDGANPPYRPVNYDEKFHGPVPLRQALGNSYNVPAVKALHFVGLPSMLEMARRLGITTFTRPDYGLSLTLGGGEVTLLQLTAAYGVIGNGGVAIPSVAILKVDDQLGRVIEEYRPAQGQQVISPQHAYLMTHILSDNGARQPSFGVDNVLHLSRPAAAKTGTTNDFRDNWTIGYVPDLAVGVWVGNNDNSAMHDVSGVAGAGPIWRNFMETALANQPVVEFGRPAGLIQVEICADSGTLPSEACPRRRLELFVENQGPLGAEFDIHQMVLIDASTNQRATEFCPAELIERRPFVIYPEEALAWARDNNLPMAPTEPCALHRHAARVEIFDPAAEQTVAGIVPVFGAVEVPDLAEFVVEYGEGSDPQGWGHVAGPFNAPVAGGLLAMWDTMSLKNMDHTLRVLARDNHGATHEVRVRVWVDNGAPLATVTPTLVATPLTPTPLPVTPTLLPATPTAIPTATASPAPPTATPTALLPTPTLPLPTATSAPVATPIAAITWPPQDALVGGVVQIIGSAGGAGFVGYQLAFGPGFDPPQWTTIAESNAAVDNGRLGWWDTTTSAGGLQTIRLSVVGGPGAKQDAVVRVNVDNEPPALTPTSPTEGQVLPSGSTISFAAEALDNLGIDRIELYLDGVLQATLAAPPYLWEWAVPQKGAHTAQFKAYDLAGNITLGPEIAFTVGETSG